MKNYLVYLAYLLLFSSCFNNTSIPSSSLSENSITPSNHSLSTHSEYQSNDNNSLADISAYYTVCSENEMIALNKLENQIIQDIFCGDCITGFLTETGLMFQWGNNTIGGIGNGWQGTREISSLPTPIFWLQTLPAPIKFADNSSTTGAITTEGELYTWGMELSGYSGHTDSYHLTPHPINIPGKVVQYSIGGDNSLILLEDGSVYRGGLKPEKYTSYYEYSMARPSFAWDEENIYGGQNNHLEPLTLNFNCIQVDTLLANLFLSDAGEVYILGLLMGNHPAGEADFVFPEITKLPFPEKITKIIALGTNIAALSESGKIYIYGSTGTGIAGKNDTMISTNLYIKNGLPPIKLLEGNEYTLLALGEDNGLYAWGMNTHQIIDTAQENRAFISEPKKIIFEENIKDIAIGNGNIAVLTGNRDIYMWGLNTTGQIYGYEADYAYEPFKVPLP